jgi:hypothetical protein
MNDHRAPEQRSRTRPEREAPNPARFVLGAAPARGVLTREGAEIGVLISFEEPSAGMRAGAAAAGFHESPWGKHPRIQLRTIRELLDNRGIDYPHVTGANVTHRRALRARTEQAEALPLFGAEPTEEE